MAFKDEYPTFRTLYKNGVELQKAPKWQALEPMDSRAELEGSFFITHAEGDTYLCKSLITIYLGSETTEYGYYRYKAPEGYKFKTNTNTKYSNLEKAYTYSLGYPGSTAGYYGSMGYHISSDGSYVYYEAYASGTNGINYGSTCGYARTIMDSNGNFSAIEMVKK